MDMDMYVLVFICIYAFNYENLLCENKINLFQSVYYGLILGVHNMT